MSLERSRLNAAEYDRATITTVEMMIRGHLLAALSEARSMTAKMEPHVRDKLMDGLGQFHPDGGMTDVFGDAFTDAITLADNEVEMRKEALG